MLRFVSVPLEIDEIDGASYIPTFTVFETRRTEKGSQPTARRAFPSRYLITLYLK